jgi:phosphoenolpyruvate carboxylase
MPPERLEPSWRAAVQLLADHNRQVYRALVFGEPQFYEFFRQLTPIDVIERLQIGSRPSSHTDSTGLEALRSIPWVHAWSQARYMLPGWFGAGSALAKAKQELGAESLQEMYQHWFFFTNLIDDIELALARADLEIASLYDELVMPELRHFIDRLRAEYLMTRDCVLEIKSCKQLLDSELTVQRSIRLRSPYIDPMHLVQVDLLRRWRAGACQDKELLAALLASITGISQALQGAY